MTDGLSATPQSSLLDRLAAAGVVLVKAVAAEQQARRAGRWTEMHETSTALASMAFELVLIEAEA